MTFQLTSEAFNHEDTIPQKYTCDGEDVSPPLNWEGAPTATASYILICDDPDAPVGTFTHWVVFNIPAEASSLPQGFPAMNDILGSEKQVGNDFKKIGYGGPCPPPGPPHRYYFRLYALDIALDLDADATRDDVEGAMDGHVLDKTELMGRYGRG